MDLPDFDMTTLIVDEAEDDEPVIVPKSLADVDLAHELVTQYQTAKTLYKLAMNDGESTPQQKAAVLNTITSILKQIILMQTALYNAERVKRLESVLLQALKTLPDEARDLFMAEYERELTRT